MWFIDNLHYIVCAFCVLHSVIESIRMRRLKKKVEKYCEQCSAPIYEGEEHKCLLSDRQLSALATFVATIKDGDNNAG